MLNCALPQVLHHLEPTKVDSRYPVARDTLKEAIRVLKKGGVIVIDTCSHEQVRIMLCIGDSLFVQLFFLLFPSFVGARLVWCHSCVATCVTTFLKSRALVEVLCSHDSHMILHCWQK